MIDVNKKYRTRARQEVRIYATDGAAPRTVHGAIQYPSGEWIPHSWYPSGLALGHAESVADLIEVKPRHKRTVWFNVYQDTIASRSLVWDNKKDADAVRGSEAIACVKVEFEFEEGEGL